MEKQLRDMTRQMENSKSTSIAGAGRPGAGRDRNPPPENVEGEIKSTDATGLLAIPCPEHGTLHALSECARVEILNASLQPCAPGEAGRLVATPLHNFAMPLFRLDTGVDAIPDPPCPCGRGLPAIARIGPRA